MSDAEVLHAETQVTLDIDGQRHELTVHPGEPLVAVLRDRIGVTAAKLVCGSGVCGACTVLLDGTPVNACLLPAVAAAGRAVRTAAGLADGDLHPVMRAIATRDALQCGFCTPGFVVQAAAFCDRWRAGNPDGARPPRDEIAAELAGHLCRCGVYPAMLDAVADACAGDFDAAASLRPARVEAPAKVTGQAVYTADVRLPGMLHGAIVRSSRPHARITALDLDTLRAQPGVRAVVDLLPPDRIARYVGEPLAAVAADSVARARAAVRAAAVTYEDLPAVVDPAAAMAPGAPAIHADRAARRRAPVSAEGVGLPGRWRGNLRLPLAPLSLLGGVARRRVRRARATGNPLLVEATFTTAAQMHTSLEPHCTVARWNDDASLDVWHSTQAVREAQRFVAQRWGLTDDRVRVIATHVGGGFGAKQAPQADLVAAVELAKRAGAPVSVVLDRSEELTATGYRPGTRTAVALLADRGARLRALTVDSQGRGGIAVGSVVAVFAAAVYGRAPRWLRDVDVVTNDAPGNPFRGPGGPPMCWALEQAVDEMARRLETDPIALRRRWDGNRRRHALYAWAAGLELWRRRPDLRRQGRYRQGAGVAMANWLYLVDSSARVEVEIRDGRVLARAAVQDPGTGTRTVVARVIAEELGLDEHLIDVEVGDSVLPPGPPSAGSRVTTSIAPAAADAARRLRRAIGLAPGADAARALAAHEGARVVGERTGDRFGLLTPFGGLGGLQVGRQMSGAVVVAGVEVDTWLGTVRVPEIHVGVAAGRIYQPRLARSQVEGAAVQGVSYALYESRSLDPTLGVNLSDNLEDYRIAGIGDAPRVGVHFHEAGWAHVPGGGVGIGEVSTIGVAAAVGNAIRDATGWRPTDLPVTPQRLVEGMRHAGAAGELRA